MKMSALVAAACALVSLVGCAPRVVVHERHPRPVVVPAPAPAPVVVERTVAVSPGVVVEEVELVEAPSEPPPPIVEVRPVAPHRSAVWIEGHWVYTRSGWRWSNGLWSTAPAGHHHYVSGHWERRGHVRVWVPGHWK